VPDLEQIADAGFNLVHPTVDARNDMADLFDVAEARGVYVIGETPYPANGPDDFINKWKDRAAVIGWSIADDFNAPYAGPTYNHPPAEIEARHVHQKALVPGHLTYASGGSYPGFRIAEFAGKMDVMGFQSYPLSAGNSPEEYALQENVDSFDWVRDQLAGSGQLFIANPQAYRWSDPGARYPTPREERNFVYAPLLRGAKGILWYAFWEGADHLLPARAPELWADLPRQVAELKSLTPFLLHGVRTELATGNPRLHAARWELDRQVVTVVLSTHRTSAFAVALDLPPGAGEPSHRLFPDRPETGLAVAGGQLVGSVGPEDVHVILVDLPTPGNQSPAAAFDVAPDGLAFGEQATFDASASFDPDGSVAAWEWDLGDGTLASGPAVAHTYRAPGTYFVRLTVRDDDGAPATTIAPLDVGVTSLCGLAAAGGCRAPGGSTISIRLPGPASGRTLKWTWARGDTALDDLGDPTTSTEYALCVYDAGGLVVATGVRPDAGKWKSLGATGFRLRDPSARPGGLTAARLKPGASPSARLFVKGKGVRLPALPLPFTLPVTVQLVTSDSGTCWQGSYAASPATRNTPQLFRASGG
jgi:PKD repeat protein